MANPRYNTQVAQPRGMKMGGRVKKMGGGMSTARKDMASGYYKDDMGMGGGAMYKKGGSVKKKKIPAGKKGKGIRALKKKAPKVAKAMGYKKGGKA
jgi:hypothetical protein|tara:strand:+ start:33 stop:320 length:288 start_codon:yes stop_codon:yes gene_type:complete